MSLVPVFGLAAVSFLWIVLSVQDLRTHLISPLFLYLMTPFVFLYLDFGWVLLGVAGTYVIFSAWAWVTEGVGRGDVTMLFFYGLTTANTPLLAFQTLLLTAGSSIILSEKLLNQEKTAFAPIFALNYLLVQGYRLFA